MDEQKRKDYSNDDSTRIFIEEERLRKIAKQWLEEFNLLEKILAPKDLTKFLKENKICHCL